MHRRHRLAAAAAGLAGVFGVGASVGVTAAHHGTDTSTAPLPHTVEQPLGQGG